MKNDPTLWRTLCRTLLDWIPRRRVLLACGPLLLAAPGCGGSTSTKSNDASVDAGTADLAAVPADLATSPDLLGTRHFQFVMSGVRMPDSGDPTTRYYYDVDGSGTKVNKLLAVSDALKTAGGTPLQPTVDQAISMGQLIELLDVGTVDPTMQADPDITVSGYIGKLAPGMDPTTLFDDSAPITLDLSDQPKSPTLQGSLVAGRGDTLHLPPGAFSIQFPLQGVAPTLLHIYAAHVQFQATLQVGGRDGGATTFALGDGPTFPAMLNGGLKMDEVHSRLVPAIAGMVQGVIDQPGSPYKQSLLNFFDQNHDGKVTPDEIEGNGLVSSILSPDVDLFDANGNLAPNQDKVKDSLSFGVSFVAVPAHFTAPTK